MTDDRMTRLSEVAHIAVPLEKQTACPAQLMIAQWAVESLWGAKPAGRANYFGIKKAERHTMCCTVTTHEVIGGVSKIMALEFADYPSLADSCADYAWLITQGGPYKDAWVKYETTRDLHALIAAVAATYATAPSYAAMVSQIAGQQNVADAIAAARQEPV
jgi:flagellum-specific peptidoglycan hydrolase FlgJ